MNDNNESGMEREVYMAYSLEGEKLILLKMTHKTYKNNAFQIKRVLCKKYNCRNQDMLYIAFSADPHYLVDIIMKRYDLVNKRYKQWEVR